MGMKRIQLSFFLVLPTLLILPTRILFSGDAVILPGDLLLDGPEARQHLLVLKKDEVAFRGEIPGLKLVSSNPAVVVIDTENALAIPKGDGTATISALAENGDRVCSVKAKVVNFGTEVSWSFRNHVLPILSKKGCNQGACHGALAGKGGFRLSLRGYDPQGDFYTITRGDKGRRTELADPGRSLFLAKPTMAAPHKGGKRLDPRSRDYRIISQWIAGGATPPREEDAVLEKIEVFPDLSILKLDDREKLIVTATYSDGKKEDVSDWVKFTSTDDTVANVDDDGHITVVGYGEGAVTAWFSSQVVLARLRSPFPNDVPDAVFSSAPRKNFIDDLVLTQLQQLRLKPSRRTNDSEFIRRVYLDTTGVLPTVEETKKFLANRDPSKRDQLIEQLLNRKEFVDYWAYRWSDVFLVNGKLLRPEAVKAYYEWIRKAVEKDTPWDELARQIVTAKGSSLENGATNFYSLHQDPETMAENVSKAFLGLSINCAKCHNHPLEKWTNDQYYAFANIFARVRGKGWSDNAGSGDGKRVLYVEPRGDLIQPRTGKPQLPAPLDGKAIDPDETTDRREHLADWLTSPDNTLFSRAVTNRVWGAYFGRGLVDPVDDLRSSNPASNEALLNALSEYLVKNGFDLKKLMRVILQSETYQRSGEVLSENREDVRYLSRCYPRRQMAEILYDAIAGVTNTPAKFEKVVLKDGSTQNTKFYKEGTRSLELFDSAVQSYFLKTFGRNEREITCECERSNQPSMVQVLHLSNGDTLNERLRRKDGMVTSLLKSGKTDSQIVDEAFLKCLSRFPVEREKQVLSEQIRQAATPEEKHKVVEDLFWALMTSREFLFQH